MPKDEGLKEPVPPDVDYLNPQTDRSAERREPWGPSDDLHVALFVVELILPIVCSMFATTPAVSTVIIFMLPAVGTAIAWYLVRESRWKAIAIVCLILYGIPLLWILIAHFIQFIR